jgi:hypothetical protein
MRQKMRTTVTKLGIALVAWIGGRGNAHPYPDRMIKSEADQTTFDLTFQMARRTPSARMQSIAYSSCPSWSRSEAEALKSCCTR